ncbi:MAG: hypothetical protein FD153_1890 [Rhodospirillaceae bacterium]|nr:MAG: hypothetical protein FD153_1890 [Rhodospirillaceae bacterium]
MTLPSVLPRVICVFALVPSEGTYKPSALRWEVRRTDEAHGHPALTRNDNNKPGIDAITCRGPEEKQNETAPRTVYTVYGFQCVIVLATTAMVKKAANITLSLIIKRNSSLRKLVSRSASTARRSALSALILASRSVLTSRRSALTAAAPLQPRP